MYLMWFDDTKKPTPAKIAEAVAAYRERFKYAPTVVLTSERDRVDVEGIEVRSEAFIRPNNFWVGAE